VARRPQPSRARVRVAVSRKADKEDSRDKRHRHSRNNFWRNNTSDSGI
jgi:hypothetical protein